MLDSTGSTRSIGTELKRAESRSREAQCLGVLHRRCEAVWDRRKKLFGTMDYRKTSSAAEYGLGYKMLAAGQISMS